MRNIKRKVRICRQMFKKGGYAEHILHVINEGKWRSGGCVDLRSSQDGHVARSRLFLM